MKIEEIIHTHVKRDGTFEHGPGAVETSGCIRMSDGCGCGIPNCHCSDGYWISVFLPLENRMVKGIKVTFDNKKEMDYFFKFHEIIM